MIVETYQETATTTDILAAPSRLASIPYNGTLILEFISSAYSTTNAHRLTIQLPDGSTPLDGVGVPASQWAGGFDGAQKYAVSFGVVAGGHVLVSTVLTGTSTLFVRATLMP
jgi:hypothetical protein